MLSAQLTTILLIIQLTVCRALPSVETHSSSKFSLKVVDEDGFLGIINNETMMKNGRIENLYEGSEYSCYLPNFSSTLGKQTLQDEEYDAFLKQELVDGVDIINDALANQCILSYGNDLSFWRYMLCTNLTRQLTQRSATNVPHLFYILGELDNYNLSEYQYVYNEHGSYISQLLSDGTICDLTGYPRVTEVKYMCDSTAKFPFISKVRETETCQYLAEVFIPGLCKLSTLNDEENAANSNNIYCYRDNRDLNPLYDLLWRYSVMFMGDNIYFLTPYDSTRDRPQLLYHMGKYPSSISDLPMEQEFIQRFAVVLPELFKSKLITVENGKAIRLGDNFLWRSPILDYEGNILMMVDLSMNSSSEAIAKVNHNISLLKELPLNNFVYFNPATTTDLSTEIDDEDVNNDL